MGRRPLQTHDGVANDDGAEQGVLVMRMPSTCDPHALPAHLAKQLNNQNYQVGERDQALGFGADGVPRALTHGHESYVGTPVLTATAQLHGHSGSSDNPSLMVMIHCL